MSKDRQKYIRPLTGSFLGWGDSCTPHRYIRVATANGELAIKVSKQLRPQIQDLQPGVWLAMISQERMDVATGELEIKVKQLLKLPDTNIPEYSSSSSVELVAPAKSPAQIRICQGSSCRRRGSEKICQMMQSYLNRTDLNAQVEIKAVKCLHQCKDAPHIIIPDSSEFPRKHYRQVRSIDIDSIMMDTLPTSCPLVSI
jgi:NADH:ubiquinone oxidoreductase subunit E